MIGVLPGPCTSNNEVQGFYYSGTQWPWTQGEVEDYNIVVNKWKPN